MEKDDLIRDLMTWQPYQREEEKNSFQPTDIFSFLEWFCAPEQRYVLQTIFLLRNHTPIILKCFVLFYFIYLFIYFYFWKILFLFSVSQFIYFINTISQSWNDYNFDVFVFSNCIFLISERFFFLLYSSFLFFAADIFQFLKRRLF